MKLLIPSVLVLALAGFVAHPVGASGPSQSTSEEAPAIAVSGTGEVQLDPDHATLIIAIDTNGPTSAAAAADNARVTAVVRSALLAAGAAHTDIVTANYTVQPQWQYANNAPPRRVGYAAHNNLQVSVAQLPLLGSWIDKALGAGASRIENIEFDSKDAASARQQALNQAVANAKADAQTLAKAAGGRLGALLELSTQQSVGPRHLEEVTVSASARQPEPTLIEPSPLHISATVTARWRFEP